jgi:hypothetical protein
MNIYVNPNGAMEDLVNTLEELRPGMVSSRMVLEITTEDKGLAALLKKLAEDIPDEVNAGTPAKPGRKTKRGKAISLKAEATKVVPTSEDDGGEL